MSSSVCSAAAHLHKCLESTDEKRPHRDELSQQNTHLLDTRPAPHIQIYDGRIQMRFKATTNFYSESNRRKTLCSFITKRTTEIVSQWENHRKTSHISTQNIYIYDMQTTFSRLDTAKQLLLLMVEYCSDVQES